MTTLRLLFLAITLIASSCAAYSSVEKLSDVQMLCSNGTNFLITSATESDVRRAIKDAYDSKVKYGTSEDYTPIRLKDGRSLSIAKLPPEEAVKCSFKGVPANMVEGSYFLQ